MRVILLSTLVLMWASLCLSYGFYKSKIPNGNNVPDPWHEGKMWDGVGHVAREGGGRRNRFGRDFQSVGFEFEHPLSTQEHAGVQVIIPGNVYISRLNITKYIHRPVWNAELCKKDSDGDGKTNGKELCDPHCHWHVGQPDPECKVSHPGRNDNDCP